MLNAIGEDPKRQGLKKTPIRAANALWFFTKGYRQDLKGILFHFVIYFKIYLNNLLKKKKFYTKEKLL